MLKNIGFHLASVEYSGDTLGKNLLSGSPGNPRNAVQSIQVMQKRGMPFGYLQMCEHGF
ncbi:hypothetical protein [Paenibacillus cineris]|uniref:Uncharacterized protein n=1 Tax=Paenibacillus cineris TaxID=237530 RepID=A0ABQ4LCV4_9BACL|nr:hypothetical protein [Paenibacillus cineris]GIO54389.1 hypothetical protein J21TS7_27070 [Paenibacillus cineris]